MDHPLDNVVWTSLTTRQASLAIGQGKARHYPRDMAPFSAIAEPTEDAFRDLAANLPAGIEARLFRLAEEPVPPGWDVLSVRPILQMVACSTGDRGHFSASSVEILGPDDMAAMQALAAAADPGPFGPRTGQLGRYVGIREHDQLVAMAGERFKVPGFTEISAICTHPTVRGRGFGRAVTERLVRDVLSRGEQPFLHVFPANERARRLYRGLGFTVRRTLMVVWVRPVAQ